MNEEASPPTPSPLNPPKGEVQVRREQSGFLLQKQIVDLWKPSTKHNQSPPWGIEGAYNST